MAPRLFYIKNDMEQRRKILYFTVTNDLTYDQRMIRICTSLAADGHGVTLVGRELKGSMSLLPMPFGQKRLKCFFNKGFLFYAEFNLRLFFFLLTKRMDLICAIDLDTIIPCYYIARFKGIKKVYDAHELFCEMKEVVTRPFIYKCWKKIERSFVPYFTKGYTVNNLIAAEFRRMYGVEYTVIMNMTSAYELTTLPQKEKKYILYQGAVNEGRCFETLIPAMKEVQASLIICGDGNFMAQAKALAAAHHLNDKILFAGKIPPLSLREYTLHAYIGVTLFENTGKSNYLSLGNRFFDYIQAGVPQLCVNYPLYSEINERFKVALLINNSSVRSIADGLNRLLDQQELYTSLRNNCLAARKELNWEKEELKLLQFYREIFMK